MYGHELDAYVKAACRIELRKVAVEQLEIFGKYLKAGLTMDDISKILHDVFTDVTKR